MKTLIHNGNIILTNGILKNSCLLINNGIIEEIIDKPYVKVEGILEIDAQGQYISPGFIDAHVHGGGGADIMDGTVEAVITVAATHLRHGMTSFLPTTLTSSTENITQSIRAVEQAMASESEYTGSRILGIHLEGPYFSMKYKGAQNPEHLFNPSINHYEIMIDGSSIIKKVSMAPELNGAMELSMYLQKKRVVSSVAHSDADFDCVKLAGENGFSHITHMFNGMSGLKSPDYYCIPGVIESGLLLDKYTAEIIADGKHMPYAMLNLLYKCKGKDKMLLTTDAVRITDTDVKEYYLGGLRAIVDDDVSMLADRTSFAGSIATADRLVRTAVKIAGFPLHEAVAMVTINTAKHVNEAHRLGSIETGKIADIVIFDDDINIKMVMQDGEIVV